jgi:tetratricopeptide (TPR) repeat protein
MVTQFWKKEFDERDWADDEYAAPVIKDAAIAASVFKDVVLNVDDDDESFEEFEIPAGYEYREGWIYIGEGKEIVKDDYYANLPPELKVEFKDLFVDRNQLVVARCPAYVIDGDNTLFFQLVFTYVTRFRKIISIALLENLYEYLYYRFIDKPKILSRMNDKLIRIYFARRADEADNLYKCEEKCREDIAFNFEYVPDFPRNLGSYKRLVIILENLGELEEAKAFCERAIALGLTDKTKADYPGRLEKIEKKIARREKKNGKKQ